MIDKVPVNQRNDFPASPTQVVFYKATYDPNTRESKIPELDSGPT